MAWGLLAVFSAAMILFVQGARAHGKRQIAIIGTPVLLFGLTTVLVILDRALSLPRASMSRRLSTVAASILLLGVLVMIVAFVRLIFAS